MDNTPWIYRVMISLSVYGLIGGITLSIMGPLGLLVGNTMNVTPYEILFIMAWVVIAPVYGVLRLNCLEKVQKEKIPVLVVVLTVLIALTISGQHNNSLEPLLVGWGIGSFGILLPYFRSFRLVMKFLLFAVGGAFIGVICMNFTFMIADFLIPTQHAVTVALVVLGSMTLGLPTYMMIKG